MTVSALPPQGWPIGQSQPLVVVGDIACYSDRVTTPSGTYPLAGTQWNVADMTRTETRIPPVAIVLAIIFFIFCLLGLLFLLMKETVVTGHMQVIVQGSGWTHMTYIPMSNSMAIQDVHGRVNYIRTLVAAAGYQA
jgi:hypothetical protein